MAEALEDDELAPEAKPQEVVNSDRRVKHRRNSESTRRRMNNGRRTRPKRMMPILKKTPCPVKLSQLLTTSLLMPSRTKSEPSALQMLT
jgi:hypothetical protein